MASGKESDSSWIYLVIVAVFLFSRCDADKPIKPSPDSATNNSNQVASSPPPPQVIRQDSSTVQPYVEYADPIVYSQEVDEQRITDAKQAVVDAQYDLNRSVRSLSYGDWENDLPTVQRRLRALENANSDLGSVDGAAAAEMDWEIRRMKREMGRLDDENWRSVVPDIERRNRSISWESDNLESSMEE